MEEWNEYKIGDLFSHFKSGKGIKVEEVSSKGIYPVFGGNGLRGYTTRNNFEGDCAIIGRQGAFCGNVRYFKGKAYMTEHAIIAVANENNNTRFLAYLLSLMNLGRFSGQSVQPGLSVTELAKQPIAVPPLPIQEKIASILSSLDDKIELNRRINDNLEQQAQALFKSWFVDFEPFKDGEFVKSELGMIPGGWNVQSIYDVFNFQEGPGIRNWQYVNDGTKFINIRCINNGVIDTQSANMISHDEAQGKYSHFMLNEDDVVMSCSGTLGRSAIVLKEYLPLCLNTSVIRFVAKESAHLGFMYCYLGSSLFLDKQKELASGSAQVNFGPTHLKTMKLAIPENRVLDKFSSIINIIIKKKKSIISETLRLTSIRDTLLPKLMSGEVKISEIETEK